MAYLDKMISFDRTEATPFHLLNCHGSQFDLPFLDNVNAADTNWTVCIGVLYGMNLWQVGDSVQQNGAYKSRLALEKSLLLQKKQKMQLDFRIDRHDVVGLVHRAWEHSFAKVENNRKAITERGQNPLTFNLLDLKELQREKDDKVIKNAYQLASIHGKETVDSTALTLTVELLFDCVV
jgi:hypothetical protein